MPTTLTRRQEEVVLFQGDDEARLNALVREVDALRDRLKNTRNTGPTRLLDEPDPVEELRARIEELSTEHDTLLAEATPRAVRVLMVSVGRKVWAAMVEANPPREGDEDDEKAGMNEEGFAENAVAQCLAEPVFAGPGEKELFLDSLSNAQFNRLYLTAVGLNRVFGAAPKALLASPPSPNVV